MTGRFILSRLTRHSIEDYELLAGDQSIMQHLVPSAGRPSAAILALDAARQRQLELERNPPKPSPTLSTPAITPAINGTPANPSPELGATPAPGAGTSPSPYTSSSVRRTKNRYTNVSLVNDLMAAIDLARVRAGSLSRLVWVHG